MFFQLMEGDASLEPVLLRSRPSLDTISSLANGRKILYCVFWGSQVYQTASATSDWDVICVVEDSESFGNVAELRQKIRFLSAKNAVQEKSHGRTRGEVICSAFGEVTFVPLKGWLRAIFEHRIEFLEGMFAPKEFVLLPFQWEWSLNKDFLGLAVEWEAGNEIGGLVLSS